MITLEEEVRMLEPGKVRRIVEAALLCADEPLTVERLESLFAPGECDREVIRTALNAIERAANEQGYELKRVASGYRLQVPQELAPWVGRLWEEKPPRYSRALLETLALIAYRQPVTRGDIEQVRGVVVSSNIIRTLLEREWIRVVGFREVPGRPAMYGTTKAFLDYFNLKSLDELPPLSEVRSLIEPLEKELEEAGPEYAEGLREGQSDPSPDQGEPRAAADAPDPGESEARKDERPLAKVVPLPRLDAAR